MKKKNIIILGIIFLIIIIGGIFYFKFEICKPYRYTFILDQKVLNAFGETGKIQNPYNISCNELKYNYCLSLENSSNPSSGNCNNKDIGMSCDELARNSCNTIAGAYNENKKICTQKEFNPENPVNIPATIINPGLINKEGIITKERDLPDC